MNDSYFILCGLYVSNSGARLAFMIWKKYIFEINFKKCKARKISASKNGISDHKHCCMYSACISLFATTARELRIEIYFQKFWK